MSGFIVKKNPSQKLRKEQTMISGMQFKEHMSHMRTAQERMGSTQGKNTAAAPNKA